MTPIRKIKADNGNQKPDLKYDNATDVVKKKKWQ